MSFDSQLKIYDWHIYAWWAYIKIHFFVLSGKVRLSYANKYLKPCSYKLFKNYLFDRGELKSRNWTMSVFFNFSLFLGFIATLYGLLRSTGVRSVIYDWLIIWMTKSWYTEVLRTVEPGIRILDIGIGKSISGTRILCWKNHFTFHFRSFFFFGNWCILWYYLILDISFQYFLTDIIRTDFRKMLLFHLAVFREISLKLSSQTFKGSKKFFTISWSKII